jgi:2-C-methyl-D-erythritol 2,4-cyclodiphosphate synthase
MFRVGIGYDIHPFAPEGSDRVLMLGGVVIEGARGLAGHSDADVLLHSVCDAVLGALGLGDLGRHFPDSDPSLKGIASIVLLTRVVAMMKEQGYCLINLDTIVIAQKPAIAPFADAIRQKIASVVEAVPAVVNVKATSPEKIGGLGRGEGIAAESIALLGLV